MTTLTHDSHRLPRPTPKKLGDPPRRDANARDEYHRQLDFLVAEGRVPVRVRDFLVDVLYAYSDKTAKDFYPSQATMAKHRRCSRRTIQRGVKAAKDAGVLQVAQLKGFDPATSTWYCSSNTHRPSFVTEWLEKMSEARKARAEARREKRIQARAQRPGARPPYRGEETRPPVPPVDEEKLARDRAEALSPEETRIRAQEARDVLLGRKPPP